MATTGPTQTLATSLHAGRSSQWAKMRTPWTKHCACCGVLSCACWGVCAQVVLRMSKELPLVVEYRIADLGNLSFYLAPKVLRSPCLHARGNEVQPAALLRAAVLPPNSCGMLRWCRHSHALTAQVSPGSLRLQLIDSYSCRMNELEGHSVMSVHTVCRWMTMMRWCDALQPADKLKAHRWILRERAIGVLV